MKLHRALKEGPREVGTPALHGPRQWLSRTNWHSGPMQRPHYMGPAGRDRNSHAEKSACCGGQHCKNNVGYIAFYSVEGSVSECPASSRFHTRYSHDRNLGWRWPGLSVAPEGEY